MKVISRDTWIGFVMLIVAGIYWFEAGKIRVSPLDDGIGAAGLPKALAYALGALAVLLILRSTIGTVVLRKTSEKAAPKVEAKALWAPHFRAFGMLVIGIAYLLVVSWLGYAISIAALLFCCSLYIGAKLNLRTVLVALIGGIAYHLLFVEFLGIPLPSGAILGPFLDG